MRKFFCDICGKEIPEDAHAGPVTAYTAISVCDGVTDVCPECQAIGEKLDIGGMVLDAWRKACTKVYVPASEQHKPGAVPATDVRLEDVADMSRPDVVAPDVKDGSLCAALLPKKPSARPGSGISSVWSGTGGKPVQSVRDSRLGGAGTRMDASQGQKDGFPDGQSVGNAAGPKPRRKRGSEDAGSSAGQSRKGGHWSEKRIIMDRLTSYRSSVGLGSTQTIAEKSGIPADTIRLMLNAQPYPIEIWRKVDKALDALGAPPGVDHQ